MKKNLFLSLLLLFSSLLFSQDVDYARFCLNKLTSEQFHGRGYVKKGDLKAAKFIATEFKKDGLNGFTPNYFQHYAFPINTFPGKIKLKLNDVELKPGSDFVISLSNSATKGEYELVYLSDKINNDSLLLDYINKNEFKENTVLVVNGRFRLYGHKLEKVAGVVIVENKKIWWHVSNGSTTNNTLWIRIHKDNLQTKPTNLYIDFDNKFFDEYKTQNVVGFVKGKKYPDKYYAFTAHYDHLGMMGKTAMFPGANDNASGTSMLMDLARFYSLPENQPDYSIVFMAFSGEESGLNGSSFFAANPLLPLKKIKLLINLDMVGSGSDGITVVNSSVYPDLLEKMRKINNEYSLLKQVKERGESCNSDHCPFYQKGVKSVFIYTMGKELPEYHTVNDKSENFPFTAYDQLFKLITKVLNQY